MVLWFDTGASRIDQDEFNPFVYITNRINYELLFWTNLVGFVMTLLMISSKGCSAVGTYLQRVKVSQVVGTSIQRLKGSQSPVLQLICSGSEQHLPCTLLYKADFSLKNKVFAGLAEKIHYFITSAGSAVFINDTVSFLPLL